MTVPVTTHAVPMLTSKTHRLRFPQQSNRGCLTRKLVIFSVLSVIGILEIASIRYVLHTPPLPPNAFNDRTTEQQRRREEANDMVAVSNISPNVVGLPSNAGTTPQKMKIVAFTDKNFVALAVRWYNQLTKLGYNEHVIVAVDHVALAKLKRFNYRVEASIPKTDKKYTTEREPLGQFWYRRIRYCMNQVKNGISLLVTDVDISFTRYIPLSDFQNSGYDVIHSYAMRYPDHIFDKYGLVVCGCLTWYTATPRTLAFLELVEQQCNKNCDDQEIINKVLLNSTIGGIVWENKHSLKRVNSTDDNNGLLETGMIGRSTITGHSVKIWDRDFVWRGPLRPQSCPSEKNWVAMPAGSLPKWAKATRAQMRFLRLNYWENHCGPSGSKRFKAVAS